MAAQSKTAALQYTVPEVQNLRNAVELMDCLSQSGFSEISSIAKLALYHLETSDGYRHLDNIINSEAEQVGCNYVDDAQRRRWDVQRDAQRAHRETVEA